MEGLGNVVEVASVETSDGDATIGCHVNGVLFTELVDHLRGETSVSKHTNLVDHVIPVVFTAQILHVLMETVSHLVHAAGHELEIVVPH